MLDWLIAKTSPNQQQIKNPYVINYNSTLYIECAPNDPHTASNIVITAFVSKTQRSIVPIKVEWSRCRDADCFRNQGVNSYQPQRISSHKSNTYLCEPADLGCYLNAKIYSLDESLPNWAQVTIGPIKIDVMIKRLMEGAMFSETILQQVVFLDGESERNGTIRLNSKTIDFKDDQSQVSVEMPYTISQPKIQINPKDYLKVYLRFEQDQQNKVQKYLAKIFDRPLPGNLSRSLVHNSRARLFKSVYCANKFEFKFLSRHTRDLFLFMHKAFICKEMLKTTVVFQKLEKLKMIQTEESYNKFLEFTALREQINRLTDLAHELQKDRDKKITDVNQLEESIGELTLTYMKIIEQKSKLDNVDLNKSYSEIGMKREEMINRKNFRETMEQNQMLKNRIRDLTEQIQMIKYFKKDQQNDSLIMGNFNQNRTANPFLKKPVREEQITPIRRQFEDHGQHKNMIELSRSCAKLLKENQKLKQKSMVRHKDCEKSSDMIDLLNSLDEEKETKDVKKQPSLIFGRQSQIYAQSQLQTEDVKNLVQMLKKENQELKKAVSNYQAQQSIMKTSRRLTHSVAHENKSFIQGLSKSMVSNNEQYNESETDEFKTIPMNQSMTSQAEIKLLQDKFIEISNLNQKILEENARLRKERDHYRESVRQFRIREKEWEEEQKNRFSENLDNSVIVKVKQQNQNLVNQRNALRKKIDSLTRQKNSQISLGFKKLNTQRQQEQSNMVANAISHLNKQNKLLRQENQRLIQQNQKFQKIGMTPVISQEAVKLKRINGQLLQEIKNLKIQIQKRMDKQMYNSRVIELENQISHLRKGQNMGQSEILNESKAQILNLKKQNERLKSEIIQKQSKLQSQTSLIERLMQQQHNQTKNQAKTDESNSGKDMKSKSQYCNSDNSQSTDKYRKRIKDLQQQILILRRSSDALNRSRDLSMDMQGYYEEQIVLLRKEINNLIQENQKVGKMCEKYAKEAKQATKFKKQIIEKLSNQPGENILSNLNISEIQKPKQKQKSDYW